MEVVEESSSNMRVLVSIYEPFKLEDYWSLQQARLNTETCRLLVAFSTCIPLSYRDFFFSDKSPIIACNILQQDGIFMESTFAAFVMGVSRKFQRNPMTLVANVKREVIFFFFEKKFINKFSNLIISFISLSGENMIFKLEKKGLKNFCQFQGN